MQTTGSTRLLKTHEALQHFRQLSPADQEESRLYLRDLLFQLLGSCRPDLGEVQKAQMLQTPRLRQAAQALLARIARRGSDPAPGALVAGAGASTRAPEDLDRPPARRRP